MKKTFELIDKYKHVTLILLLPFIAFGFLGIYLMVPNTCDAAIAELDIKTLLALTLCSLTLGGGGWMASWLVPFTIIGMIDDYRKAE